MCNPVDYVRKDRITCLGQVNLERFEHGSTHLNTAYRRDNHFIETGGKRVRETHCHKDLGAKFEPPEGLQKSLWMHYVIISLLLPGLRLYGFQPKTLYLASGPHNIPPAQPA
jgi:hypothetical protein